MHRPVLLSISLAAALLLVIASLAPSGIHARRPSIISSSFNQRILPSGGDDASYSTYQFAALIESLQDMLGQDLCFTERHPLTLIQLCLEHGFRRLEVERSTHFFERYTQSDAREAKEELAKKKMMVMKTMQTQRSQQDGTGDDDDDFEMMHTSKPDIVEEVNRHPSVAPHLLEELERLFDAAASAPLDEVFFHSANSKKDRRFGSPFRADFARRDASALANITSEIYGRYDPAVSRLKIDRERGEATMIFPDGDMCYNHVEHREIPWSTHLRLMCSLSHVGNPGFVASTATSKPDMIKWDVRVNAQLCQVIVLVFTDKIC